MLHPTKSQSLLQWFNSMVTKGAIQSLHELSDGLQFYEIITTINDIRKGKISDGILNSSDNLAKDSSTSLISTTQAETESANEESNVEAISSAAETIVDDGVLEKHKETETKASNSKKERKNAEIEKRFDAIKEFIDEFYNLDSNSLITYSDCIKKKELELAKVAVLLLSALVQSFLSTRNDQLYTTTLLDAQVQEDIKECLALVMEATMEDGPLKKSELHRILSRPSKSKGTPRRRTPLRGTPEIAETPETSKMPKKRRDRTSVVAEEIFESPLKSLLESPQIQFKAAMFKKDAEIYKLREAFEAEETKVIDLNLEKRSLNAELEKKKRELEFLKEEHRKLQECVDESQDFNKTKMEEMFAQKERDKQEIRMLKEELDILKKENETLYTKIDHSKEKQLPQENSASTQLETLQMKCITLEEEIDTLKVNVTFKDDKIKQLKKLIAEKDEKILCLKPYEEKGKTKTSPNSHESNIVYLDERSAREELKEKKIELEKIKNELTYEKDKSKEYQIGIQSTEDECRKLTDEVKNLQNALDAAYQQLSVYNSWEKSMLGKVNKCEVIQYESTPDNSNEISSGNPLGEANCCPSTSSEGLKRERSVKEELEFGKFWDTCSGKSIETRSRSSSALGYNRENYGNSTVSCSASEFESFKRAARAIAKLLKKKFDCPDSQHLARLEEKARCLYSVKDLCDFYHSVLDSLKTLRVAMFSVPEMSSKRKCRSQTVEETELESQKKDFEIKLGSIKQDMKNLEKELDTKTNELKAAEDKCMEWETKYLKLETDLKELNDKMEKRQQEVTDANKKYEFAKKHIEKINQENRKLLKACMLLKDDAGPKVEPCKDCEFLREKLSDVKHDRNEFERDLFELKAIARDLESKNNNLERQLKNEIKEKKKLEFQIQRESAFLSGSMSERNAVIHRYFQQGLAESKRAKIQAENERKSLIEDIERPQQVYSINTYIVNHENRDPCPEHSISNVNAYANRSIRSGFLQTDDEEDFLNHSSLAQIQRDVFPEPEDGNRRLTEIQRRNTLCRPHLQSSYPLELQNMTPTERKYFDKLRAPAQPYRRALESAPEDTHVESENDSENSQDVQHLPSRKRKGPAIQKSVQPMKKAVRTSSQARLIQRVKPITPVRKTGFISKTKSFKTPTSIRRLMRMSQKK